MGLVEFAGRGGSALQVSDWPVAVWPRSAFSLAGTACGWCG